MLPFETSVTCISSLVLHCWRSINCIYAAVQGTRLSSERQPTNRTDSTFCSKQQLEPPVASVILILRYLYGIHQVLDHQGTSLRSGSINPVRDINKNWPARWLKNNRTDCFTRTDLLHERTRQQTSQAIGSKTKILLIFVCKCVCERARVFVCIYIYIMYLLRIINMYIFINFLLRMRKP